MSMWTHDDIYKRILLLTFLSTGPVISTLLSLISLGTGAHFQSSVYCFSETKCGTSPASKCSACAFLAAKSSCRRSSKWEHKKPTKRSASGVSISAKSLETGACTLTLIGEVLASIVYLLLLRIFVVRSILFVFVICEYYMYSKLNSIYLVDDDGDDKVQNEK